MTIAVDWDVKHKNKTKTSLLGKALRTLVESLGWPSDSTCDFEDKPCKLDIKRCKNGILFISLQVGSLFKLFKGPWTVLMKDCHKNCQIKVSKKIMFF